MQEKRGNVGRRRYILQMLESTQIRQTNHHKILAGAGGHGSLGGRACVGPVRRHFCDTRLREIAVTSPEWVVPPPWPFGISMARLQRRNKAIQSAHGTDQLFSELPLRAPEIDQKPRQSGLQSEL